MSCLFQAQALEPPTPGCPNQTSRTCQPLEELSISCFEGFLHDRVQLWWATEPCSSAAICRGSDRTVLSDPVWRSPGTAQQQSNCRLRVIAMTAGRPVSVLPPAEPRNGREVSSTMWYSAWGWLSKCSVPCSALVWHTCSAQLTQAQYCKISRSTTRAVTKRRVGRQLNCVFQSYRVEGEGLWRITACWVGGAAHASAMVNSTRQASSTGHSQCCSRRDSRSLCWTSCKGLKASKAPSTFATCCALTCDGALCPVCVLIDAVRHLLVQVLAQVVSCQVAAMPVKYACRAWRSQPQSRTSHLHLVPAPRLCSNGVPSVAGQHACKAHVNAGQEHGRDALPRRW